MFVGSFQHSVDEKGRVIIPSKFREELGDNFIITAGLDHCLSLMPEQEWNEYIEHLRHMPFEKQKSRSYIRFILSHASFVSFDSQGRVTIPQNLREYAKIDSQAVITGVIDRVEIWSKDRWEDYDQNSESNFEDYAEELEGDEGK